MHYSTIMLSVASIVEVSLSAESIVSWVGSLRVWRRRCLANVRDYRQATNLLFIIKKLFECNSRDRQNIIVVQEMDDNEKINI